MSIKKIFDPQAAGRPMRVAGFMSGAGTNLVKLLERQRELSRSSDPPFKVVFIFSDRADAESRGQELARSAGIPYISYDIRRFHELRKARRTVRTEAGMKLRQEFDRAAARAVGAFGVDLIALGGYMSFLTLERCVNVHPADLSRVDKSGHRRFVGDDAVYEAIEAGETELRSSTIWTDMGVDTGPLLMLSPPLKVRLPAPLEELKEDPERLRRVADEHQERLKMAGDWLIFPATIEAIARGRLALDEKGKVYADGRPAPRGLAL